MSNHYNTEGERIAIERANTPRFEGQPLLVMYDDDPPYGTGIAAPMLLDKGTREWLREQLDLLDALEAQT